MMHYYKHDSLGILASEAGDPGEGWVEISYREYSLIFAANTPRLPAAAEPLPWWY